MGPESLEGLTVNGCFATGGRGVTKETGGLDEQLASNSATAISAPARFTFFGISGSALFHSTVGPGVIVMIVIIIRCKIFQGIEIQRFNFSARPGRAAEELQTGFDARIAFKTIDVDQFAEFIPAVMSDECIDLHFKRDAMQRVFRKMIGHINPVLIVVIELQGKGTRKRAYRQIIPEFPDCLREIWLISVREKVQNSRSARIIAFRCWNQ